MGNFKSEKKRFKDKPTFTNRNTLRLSLQIYNLRKSKRPAGNGRKGHQMAEIDKNGVKQLQMARNIEESCRKWQKHVGNCRKFQDMAGIGISHADKTLHENKKLKTNWKRLKFAENGKIQIKKWQKIGENCKKLQQDIIENGKEWLK